MTRRTFPAATIPIALSALVQYRVTRNCFIGDDFLNLYAIRNYALYQYLVAPNAGHLHVTRNLAFFLSWCLFGMDPAPYLWIAFLTHLVNVWLLFRVIEAFTDSVVAAAFGAALWGVCPLHVATVGYFSIYGHELVATAMLVILLEAARAGAAGTRPPIATSRRWYALAILGVLSFGTGITFAMTLPFALALLLPGWRRLPLASLLVVVPVLYFALNKLYEIAMAQPLPTLLMFQFLLPALPGAPLGFARLLSFGVFRLLLRWVSAPGVFPAAYALLAGLVAALAVFLWNASATARRRVAACALLVVSCYGAVVVTRLGRMYAVPATVMEADGRYHYAPLIPVTILICLALQPLWSRRPRASVVLLAAWCVLVAGSARFGAPDAELCARSDQQTAAILTAVRTAVASTPPRDTAYIWNGSFPPLPLRVFFPGWAAVFTLYYDDDVVDGRRVRFLERTPLVVEYAQKGRRSRDLLVAPPSG